MKNNLLAMLFFSVIVFDSQIIGKDNSLKSSPEKPKAGDEIRVTFNADSTVFANTEKIEMAVYLCSSKSEDPEKIEKTYSINMIKGTDGWNAKIKTLPSTDFIALQFVNDEIYENNDGRGYFIKIYNGDGNETPGSKLGYASAVGVWGVNIMQIKQDRKTALEIMKNVFKTNPQLKNNYISDYLKSLSSANNEELLKEELVQAQNSAYLTDYDYITIANFFKKMNMTDKYNEVIAANVKKYPFGTFAFNKRYKEFNAENDLNKKIEMLYRLEKDFLDKEFVPSAILSVIQDIVAQGKYELLKEFWSRNSVSLNLDFYPIILDLFIKANKEYELASEIAKESAEICQKELLNPTAKKPIYLSEKQWLQHRPSVIAQVFFKYGTILNLLKKNDNAHIQFEKALRLEPLKELTEEDLEIYVKFLTEYGKDEEALPIIEEVLKSGIDSEPMKKYLKVIYVKKEGSDKGFAGYLGGLEKTGKKGLVEKLSKEMINEPAASFVLKDLSGKNVSLADYKGKIVILDFWATWCIPCKASFPGMQKVVTKFAEDKDVHFLFIDTFEGKESAKKKVESFILQNKYSFHVLLDAESKVAEYYHVSAVPIKFVIDKESRIRFKKADYKGNEQGMVDELTEMISLLK